MQELTYKIIDKRKKEVAVTGVISDKDILEIIIPNKVKINRRKYTVTEIAPYAFDIQFKGTIIKRVELPSSIKIIGEGAFKGNQLIELELPASVREIRKYAFYNNHLEKIKLSDNIRIIDEYVFAFNNVKKIDLPKSIISIHKCAFLSNNLASLTLPTGIQSIDEYTFSFNEIEDIFLDSKRQLEVLNKHNIFGQKNMIERMNIHFSN